MYGLKDNVARKAGIVGKEENKEMEFWAQISRFRIMYMSLQSPPGGLQNPSNVLEII